MSISKNAPSWAKVAALGLVGCAMAATSSHAAVVVNAGSGFTLGGSGVGGINNLVADPTVKPAGAGALRPYTAVGTAPFAGAYGAANLNDNDGQSGNTSDGTYAIFGTSGGVGSVTLTFTGGAQQFGGIAISNGYTGRDNGTYTLTDASANVLGSYTVTTATASDTHTGADVFYLNFSTPVTTTGLTLSVTGGTEQSSISFREIEVFAVPEPASVAALGLAAAGLLGRRRVAR